MKAWLIIDGYNLLHQLEADPAGRPAGGRARLLKLLEPLLGALAEKITVVFDGRQASATREATGPEKIEIIYSPADKSADSVIENLVGNAARPEDILVVTSDRYERDSVTARGADSMASSIFIALMREMSDRLDKKIAAFNKGRRSITLADFFPESGG